MASETTMVRSHDDETWIHDFSCLVSRRNVMAVFIQHNWLGRRKVRRQSAAATLTQPPSILLPVASPSPRCLNWVESELDWPFSNEDPDTCTMLPSCRRGVSEFWQCYSGTSSDVDGYYTGDCCRKELMYQRFTACIESAIRLDLVWHYIDHNFQQSWLYEIKS